MKSHSSEEIKAFISAPHFDESLILKKDPAWPEISIVTISFNQGRFLERTILSVLNQNYPNLDYVIIDGGSSDESVNIINKYEKYLSYWVSEKDKGQSNALNKGFRQANGEILGWLNSDDIYFPNALSTIGRFFMSRSDVDVVYGHGHLIDIDDNIVKKVLVVPFNANALIYVQTSVFQPSTFWKKEIFHRVGMVNESKDYSMDVDLFYRFIKAGAKFQFLDESLGTLRLHSVSKTVQKNTGVGYTQPETHESRLEYFNIDDRTVKYTLMRILYRFRQIFYLILTGKTAYLTGLLKRKLRKDNIWDQREPDSDHSQEKL